MADDSRTSQTVRTALQEYIREQARWRSAKASEYRADRRNVTSSEALEGLADYVSRLPDDDSRLRRLNGLRDVLLPAGNVFSPGENAAGMISRFGFDRDQADWSTERTGEFVDLLVDVCEQEAYEFRIQSLQAAATTDGALAALDELDRAEEVDEDG